MSDSHEIILSDEQHAAVYACGSQIVRAGAGSGKTEVLARRAVALIAGDVAGRAPLDPERIGAITFTEKATHDMRRRIIQVLEQRLAAEKSPERRVHLTRAKRMLPLARISTIHAFCARILRENAPEAGLALDFDVLDEFESRTFRESMCEQALVAALRQGAPGANHLVGARRLRGPNKWREGALEAVVRITGEMERMGCAPQWILDATRRTFADCVAESGRVEALATQFAKLVDDYLASFGAKVATIERSLCAQCRLHATAIRRIDANTDAVGLEPLRAVCDLLPDARGKTGALIKAIKEIAVGNGNAFGLKGELIRAWGTARAIGPACDVAELLKTVAQAIDEAKRRERVATFGDLLVRTRNLLREQPNVLKRYRMALSALLVDEYQDTDAVQDEIVELLGSTAPGGSAPELFIVGDEKQSIYRFRGADVTVFNRARDWSSAPLPLRQNRRSTPNILAFVNHLGAMIMRWETSRADHWVRWQPEHHLHATRAAEFDPPIEIILTPDDPNPSARGAVLRKREGEARALACRIEELIASAASVVDSDSGVSRDVRYGDIVILLRAFTDVALYESALRIAGVPFYTVKGRGFFGCPEVIDLVELLAAVNDSRDSLALAAALRSPFFALSDDVLLALALDSHDDAGESASGHAPASLAAIFAADAPAFYCLGAARGEALHAWNVLRELREMRDREPITRVIERALELTAYEAVMLGLADGPQRVANLRKLIELARSFESRSFFTFHDFIRYLRGLTQDDEPREPQAQILGESDNVVRLMTVHQAKGLEFPVVIVADAGRGLNHRVDAPVLDPVRGLLLCDTDGSGQNEIPNELIDQYRERVADEERAESARLLYVALTRARDRLIVSEGSSARGWAKHIRDFAGTAAIETFVTSPAVEQRIEHDGVKLLLRRPIQESSGKSRTPNGAGRLNDSGSALAEIARLRLAYTPPASAELVISPTALADFERCPRQYWYRHEIGLPEGEAGGGPSAVTLGSIAHAVLERIDLTKGTASEAEILSQITALGRSAGLDADDCRTIARDLWRYIASLPSTRGHLLREVPFFMNVSPSLFVRGQIDAIEQTRGALIVRDYKYALASDGAENQYRVQMECYALAAAQTWPQHTVTAEVVFLRGRTAVAPVSLPPPDEIAGRLSALGASVIAAQRTGDFVAKPPAASACRKLRCGYISRCWPD